MLKQNINLLVATLILIFCSTAWCVELPRLVVQAGHGSAVNLVVFSPDGQVLASGGYDGVIKLWNASTGKLLHNLRVNKEINSFTFTRDNRILIAELHGNSLRRWDVKTGRELPIAALAHPSIMPLPFSAISQGGDTYVSGDNAGDLTVWNVASGQKQNSLKGFIYGRAGGIAPMFSSDGHTLAFCKEGKITLLDVRGLQELHSLPIKGHASSVAFSNDVSLLAAGGNDGWIKLWDVKSGRELPPLEGHQERVASVAFSPNGSTLASSSGRDNAIRLWDVASKRELSPLHVRVNASAIAFSPNGDVLVAGGSDGGLTFWDTANWQELHSIKRNSGGFSSLAFSPDSKILVLGSYERTLLWDMANGMSPRTLNGGRSQISSIAFSKDGRLATGIYTSSSKDKDSNIKLWDVTNGQELQTFGSGSTHIISVAISRDGSTLAAGGYEGLKFWDTSSRKEIHSFAGLKGTRSVSLSPDGNMLALVGEFADSSNRSSTVKLWDMTKNGEPRTLKGPGGNGLDVVVFSPTGNTLASSASNGQVNLWDVATDQEPRTLNTNVQHIRSIAFSPGEDTLAVGGSDGFLQLWDVNKGEVRHSLIGHTTTVTVAFSPDGRFVASGGRGDQARIWRAPDGQLLATLTYFADGTWVVMDPEGRFDTADLEKISGLHWVMPDNPLTPLPIEMFMKEYYEPRLLVRVLNEDKFKPVRKLADLKRVQPEVRIVSITPDANDPTRVLVLVEVSGAKKTYSRYGRKLVVKTAAHDLKLFRDGQLVAHKKNKVIKYSVGHYQKTFSIQLPSNIRIGHNITFSAYAFNDDGVKSVTARKIYHVPGTLTIHKGRAYLISMGVSRHSNSAWDLQFADADARDFNKSLYKKLVRTDQYQEVVQIELTSNNKESRAEKTALRAILNRLAGKPPSAMLQNLPGTEKLQTATPNDLIIIFFSGHGLADKKGNYYFLTQDAGDGTSRIVDTDLYQRSISSEDLSRWLSNVDAGDLIMIIDACQSVTSVQGNGFKPGPMGNRGLGQLSFDKGMRILAASKEDAHETDSIKHGLLSYALIIDGIENFKADHAPQDQRILLDEWLSYGVDRVPQLAREIGMNKGVNDNSASQLIRFVEKFAQDKQYPVLFNYSKSHRAIVVTSSGHSKN